MHQETLGKALLLLYVQWKLIRWRPFRTDKLVSMRDHCSRVLSVMRESHYQPNDIRGDIKICDSKYPSISWLFNVCEIMAHLWNYDADEY